MTHNTAARRVVENRRTPDEFYQPPYSRLMHLPRAQTHDIAMTRDIQIPMHDGVTLLADHYVPRGSSKLPTLLIRSPYGRKGLFSALMVLTYAKRGYQVLIQSCRGTAGFGGEFLYARHERDDGLATIEWIKRHRASPSTCAMAFYV